MVIDKPEAPGWGIFVHSLPDNDLKEACLSVSAFAPMNIPTVDAHNQWGPRQRKIFPVSLAPLDKSPLFIS
jgi:hypothetical protein